MWWALAAVCVSHLLGPCASSSSSHVANARCSICVLCAALMIISVDFGLLSNPLRGLQDPLVYTLRWLIAVNSGAQPIQAFLSLALFTTATVKNRSSSSATATRRHHHLRHISRLMEQGCLLIPPRSRFPLRGEQILHWSSHLSCSFCSGDQCLCCNFNEDLRLRGVAFPLRMGPQEEARCATRSRYLHFKLDSGSTDTNPRPLPRYKPSHVRCTRLAICFCLKDADQRRPRFLLIQCGALLQLQRAEAFYLQPSKWLLSPRVWPAHQLTPNSCFFFNFFFVWCSLWEAGSHWTMLCQWCMAGNMSGRR